MLVEIWGGPKDGWVTTVRDGTPALELPLKVKDLPFPDSEWAKVYMPIKRHVNGKFYAIWPKGV